MISIIAAIADTEYGITGLIFGAMYLSFVSFVFIYRIYEWYTYDAVVEKERKDEEERIKDEKITIIAKQYAIGSTRERILHTLADEHPMYDDIYAEEIIMMKRRLAERYYNGTDLC